MLDLPRLASITRWYCPRCKATDVTTLAGFHQQFHTCPKAGMMSVPFVREGVKAKIEMRVREDYVRSEQVQFDANGRPMMAAVTTRDEGQDCTVYAPFAVATLGDLS